MTERDLHWSDPEFLEWEWNLIDEQRTSFREDPLAGVVRITCHPGPSVAFGHGVGYRSPMFSLKENTVSRIETATVKISEATEEELRDAQW